MISEKELNEHAAYSVYYGTLKDKLNHLLSWLCLEGPEFFKEKYNKEKSCTIYENPAVDAYRLSFTSSAMYNDAYIVEEVNKDFEKIKSFINNKRLNLSKCFSGLSKAPELPKFDTDPYIDLCQKMFNQIKN